MFSYTVVLSEDLRFSVLWTGNFKSLLLEKPTDDLRKPQLCKDWSKQPNFRFYTRAEENSDSHHHNKY